MVKPAHIIVNRDDYNWMVNRFGNNGVRPAAGKLIHRVRRHVNDLELEIVRLKDEGETDEH